MDVKLFIKNIVSIVKKLVWRIMDTGRIVIKTENGSFGQTRFLGMSHWKQLACATRGGMSNLYFI